MKRNIIPLLGILLFIQAESGAQVSRRDSISDARNDSSTSMQQFGRTTAAIALTTLKVGGQAFGGILGAMIGMSVIEFNPAAAGVGAILGSSACVYWIGSIGNDRGQFKWVLLAGGINGVLYTPVFLNNQHSGFGMIGIVALAVLTTVVSETVTFYATQKDLDRNVDVSMVLLPSHTKGSYMPGVNVSIRF